MNSELIKQYEELERLEKMKKCQVVSLPDFRPIGNEKKWSCKFCSHEKRVNKLVQTRSGDEGPTEFVYCQKCGGIN